MRFDKLYSNYTNERLTAGLQVESLTLIQEIKKIKPYYWFGSANAWFIFLGSSPGGSPPKGKEDKSHYESQILFSSPTTHFTKTNDGTGFWKKIITYSKILFPEMDNEDLFRLMLAGNLIDTQEGNSSKLDKEELSKGAIESFKVFSIVKPKLVICLQKNVYKLIYDLAIKNANKEIRENDILVIEAGIKRNVKYKVPITYFQAEDELWNKWGLTRTPMHPSRSNFCNANNFKAQFLEKLIPFIKKYLEIQI